MRGRLAEVVLGCSGHYIDPIRVTAIELESLSYSSSDSYSVSCIRTRLFRNKN